MILNLLSRQLPQDCMLIVLLGLLLPLGCSSSESTSSAAPETAGGFTAAELLDKMQATYRQAKSYTDNASYIQRAVLRGEGVERETPFFRMSLAFERPNKLRFRFQEAIGDSPASHNYDLASNGLTVRSAASGVPGQIHEAIAPLALTAENFIPEPEMRAAVLGVSPENLVPSLVMLMSNQAEQPVFPQDSNPELLEKRPLRDSACYRISMTSPAGKRILWIDSTNYTLRRMELPIDAQRKLLDPNNMFSQLSIYVDFEDSTFDASIDAATFEMEIPEGGRRVRRFVPPAPSGPSPDLGEPIGNFRFVTLDGEQVNQDSLSGKIAVLDFWHTACPPCKSQTPVLEKVYQQFKDNQDVAFYAVSTDPPRITSDVVAKTLASWGSTAPVLRDSESSAYDVLNVRATPTLILLGRDGRLQGFQAGAHSQPAPLINVIQKLIDGEDLAAAAIARYEQQVQVFEQALEAATIKDSIIDVAVARPEAPSQRLPTKLTVEQVWQSAAEVLQQPGDVLALPDSPEGTPRVLVLDQGREIVALDAGGAVLSRHKLPAHEETANGFLRSAIDGQGKRWYLASGVGWQQAYVFDQQWQSTLSFPDDAHSGMGDVLLADLVGSGNLVMYVGYWGGLGIQGGTLDGRRLWSNRRLDHVLQVVAGPPAPTGDQQVWCTSTRGTVMQLTAEGKSVKELYVTGQSLMAVAVAELPGDEATSALCGLAVSDVGQYAVVGFDTEGNVQWQYELPPGEYVHQVPRIQFVRIGSDRPAWMIAAADGSIHWLSMTGALIDQFLYGDLLTGLTASYEGDTTTLWIATNHHLTAWTIQPGSEP
ncbi:MAG: redoxin domain-containing protein [Planctomycetales bacterium]|nr:redoxin domain-containing protein [Planctomycetales bacterium]